jgi:hypothetical protein
MDPIAIAGSLIRLNMVNPPGNEEAAALSAAELLAKNGFTVERHYFGQGRSSLVTKVTEWIPTKHHWCSRATDATV